MKNNTWRMMTGINKHEENPEQKRKCTYYTEAMMRKKKPSLTRKSHTGMLMTELC